MTFTYEQALQKSSEYFAGDAFAAKVFVDKYAMRGKDGGILEATPDALHDRLAGEFARIDAEKYGMDKNERFAVYRGAINRFARIVPQGSPMAAIGNPHQIMSASNCVVVASPEDSVEGIFDTAKSLAQLFKRRCGVGLSLDSLRPENMPVNNSARTTTGAWSFADFYSDVGRMIGQNGRRAAEMITMSVHHPDVEKFATMKHDKTKVTGANVSIALTDEFMTAVEKGKDYEQRWPVVGKPRISRMVSARQVWETIVKSATATAEPGLLFWDATIAENPASAYERYRAISTNPCSEISLSAFDSCRLISLNLTGYVRNAFEKTADFDFSAFETDIRTAVQMSDNLVDLELELIKKIQEVCDTGQEQELWQKLYDAGAGGRRTGLGTHGLADMLAQLRLKYDSEAALEFVDKLYELLRNTAYDASADLAIARGPFPDWNWEVEQDNAFIRRLPKKLREKIAKVGRRNVAQLTQAPTGSISAVSKCGEFDSYNISSGVEPVFRNSYVRRKKINPSDTEARVDFTDQLGDRWQEFKIYHGNVLNYMKKAGKESDSELPGFFITSDQIDWQKRVELQGVEQRYIDHAISATVNLPRGTTPEIVAGIYVEAWKKNLKGITVYVDGSRDGVLITEKPEDQVDKDGRPKHIIATHSPKRPERLPCDIHQASVKGQKWVILVGLLDGKPYELFAGEAEQLVLPNRLKSGVMVKVKSGHYNLHVGEAEDELVVKNVVKVFDNQMSAWATRLVSMSLRHGADPSFVCQQLNKDGLVTDVNKVLARVLKKYVDDGTKVSGKKCISCGGTEIVYSEGCEKCLGCGSSKCN